MKPETQIKRFIEANMHKYKLSYLADEAGVSIHTLKNIRNGEPPRLSTVRKIEQGWKDLGFELKN